MIQGNQENQRSFFTPPCLNKGYVVVVVETDDEDSSEHDSDND